MTFFRDVCRYHSDALCNFRFFMMIVNRSYLTPTEMRWISASVQRMLRWSYVCDFRVALFLIFISYFETDEEEEFGVMPSFNHE